jgi:hypothetical protein
MTPTTTDRDPHPTLAVACLRCGREDGYVQSGCYRPWRAQGFCQSCYTALTEMVARWGFRDHHQAHAAEPYTGNQGENVHQRHGRICAQGRAWSRQSALLDRLGGFLPATSPALPLPPDRDTTPAILMRHSKAWRDGEALDQARDWHTLRPTTPGGTPIALATDDAAAA